MPDSNDDLLRTFAQQVAVRGTICTVYDDFSGETPIYETDTGKRAEPYWSNSFSIDPKYAGWFTREVSWKEFLDEVLPRLERSNLLVGVNSSKPFNESQLFHPSEVRVALERKASASKSDATDILEDFAREVATRRTVCTVIDRSEDRQALTRFRTTLPFKHFEIIDSSGPPQLYTQSGNLAAPYWSHSSKIGPEFADFASLEIPLEGFLTKVLPHLEANDLILGINCTDCLRPLVDTHCALPHNVLVAVTLYAQLLEVQGGPQDIDPNS